MNPSALGYVGLVSAFGLLVWLTRLLARRLGQYMSAPWRTWTYFFASLLALYQMVGIVRRFETPWHNPFVYFWLGYFVFCVTMAFAEWRKRH